MLPSNAVNVVCKNTAKSKITKRITKSRPCYINPKVSDMNGKPDSSSSKANFTWMSIYERKYV